jgi:preprotein translocase subunit SecB
MTENAKPDAGNGPQFAIHMIYLKDVSFEAPNSPAIFQKSVRPEIKVHIGVKTKLLEDDLYDVVLSVTVTATHEGKTGFLVEVHQAGIFLIKGFEEKQKDHAINVFCPETLFPYAREVISSLVVQGGFPQLPLAPMNFEAHYAQKLQQAKTAAESAG